MNEDVLRQLGGALSRAAHSETQREHATAVCLVQSLERRFVAARRESRERSLAIAVVGNELEPSGHL